MMGRKLLSLLSDLLETDVYLVGGPVRDLLMGLEPQDYDVASALLPEEVIERATKEGIRVIPTGIDFGTVTLLLNFNEQKLTIEHTTFRKEQYKDTRKPEVAYTTSLFEDLARRDFTINAMALTKDGEVIDPFEGKRDLEAGLVRAVGNPSRRFREDPLRIIRAARFAARFNFTIEPETFEAMKQMTPELTKRVSVERVMTEITKALKQSQRPSVFFRILKETGVLGLYLPELNQLPSEELEKALALLDATRAETSDVPTLLTALLSSLPPTQVETRLRALKFSNKTASAVVGLLKHLSASKYSRLELFRALAELTMGGRDRAMAQRLAWLLKARANTGLITPEGCTRALSLIQEAFQYPLDRRGLAVTGRDLMELGFHGRQVGEALQKLLEAVWQGKVQNAREELLQYASNL